ncbi:MAG: tRNA (cmo5U34)-methyltransferase [Methanolobus sp.]|jgi:ubiquinone/menaquinone biosynthesis C-methylase UbiE|uniref:class I SAM-dependent methyltransferase n=1 Tax=Methanolobus sp. TaxID=1874737 RepID=UPI0024AAF05C|nr:class I SAM-dependent methyltransferase [Methanolobus sp.]MDI3484995.1 tRNA (cmo5U34)-methyltransferase [Methanolobus sp.]MDK2830634.1 tRNA (cmo5U34)-methyltransferase [Methanolobus sp.]
MKKIVPNHSSFFKTIVDFIPEGKKSLFELGCGTGFITEKVLKARPYLEITCIDRSPWMLEIIKNKSDLKDVKLMLGDASQTWPADTYDTIMTVLNLHHFNDEERSRIINMIYTSLNKNGVFISGDVFRPDSRQEEEIYRKQWYNSMIEAGFEEENARYMLEMRENAYESIDTMEGYRKKLNDAGFKNIYCPYTNLIYGIIVAYK